MIIVVGVVVVFTVNAIFGAVIVIEWIVVVVIVGFVVVVNVNEIVGAVTVIEVIVVVVTAVVVS